MPIGQIRLLNSAGDLVGTLTGDAEIDLSSSDFDIGRTGQRLTVAALSDQDWLGMIEDGVYRAMSGDTVKTLNGVGPSDDGRLWLHTDRCMSTKATDEYNDDSDSWYCDRYNGLELFDFCPTCSSCDEVNKLRRMTERYKEMLNAFKDISLYAVETCTARWNALEEYRGEDESNCEAFADDMWRYRDALTHGVLLWKYVTLVHMWNYVVSNVNTKTEITVAPDDEAGIVVQTMHAVPVCGCKVKMVCTIEISQRNIPDGTGGDEPYRYEESDSGTDYDTDLSMLVLSCDASFVPFKTAERYQKVTEQEIESPGYVHKIVTTEYTEIEVAGTCSRTIKFFPYRSTRLLRMDFVDEDSSSIDLDGIIDIDGIYNMDDDISGSGSNALIDINGLPIVRRVVNTTEEDYISSKTYPSRSTVTGRNTWDIEVKWEMQTVATAEVEIEQSYVRNYIFQTTRVREFAEGALVSDDLKKV